MNLGFGFHPEAWAEFISDVEWYDAREADVGERFESAVRGAIDAAVDSPESWAVWRDWDRQRVVRSKSVSGFPYRVVYFVDDDLLRIVAVAHAKRRPGYWRERLPSA